MRKLTRPRDGMFTGVCAGMADFLKWDRALFRLVYILFTIFFLFLGLGTYILYWIFVPKEKMKVDNEVDYFIVRM